MSAHRLLQNLSRYSFLARRQVGGFRQFPALPQSQFVAHISTSKKNRDTTITADHHETAAPPQTVEDFANPSKKHYQSFGFETDPDWDINIRNYMMFCTVTLCLVLGGYIMAYYPDVRIKEWTSREAYIELARREALGLPLIDPNLVPPENVHLPSEEELGDFEIII